MPYADARARYAHALSVADPRRGSNCVRRGTDLLPTATSSSAGAVLSAVRMTSNSSRAADASEARTPLTIGIVDEVDGASPVPVADNAPFAEGEPVLGCRVAGA